MKYTMHYCSYNSYQHSIRINFDKLITAINKFKNFSFNFNFTQKKSLDYVLVGKNEIRFKTYENMKNFTELIEYLDSLDLMLKLS